MLDGSDSPRRDETLEPAGDPPPPETPEGDPSREATEPPVKGRRSDALTKEGDAGDKLGDFA